ncbi:hypothetical protein EHR01_06560 [Leptospira mtsangambouensis]|uniref:Phage holin family protein n=1 Tax=Leptospira mtsangambouensis TaxID=2484912 RepID=A0ABY2P5N0_9LEPT|nr:hypothetical protein [Leptospira mtsangambouensis]TGM82437.1 hypothetical protein EHR01_06560 [Leptospira mtsangambouensis]
MKTNPSDSGPASSYQQYSSDSTKPNINQNSPTLNEAAVVTLINNIETIKSDIKDVKFKVNHDPKSYLSEISIGVISSFLVSVIFLLITSNLGKESVNFYGITIPTIFLLVFGMIIASGITYFLTKETDKKKKIRKKSNK